MINKRPIARRRDGAMSLEVKAPDDDSAITEVIAFGDRSLCVKEKGIYEIKLADKIDPDRKNIQAPNTIQRVLPYGSNEPWIGSVLLTGHELLKKEILNEQVDVERAISLVLEVTQNIAGAKELMNVFRDTQSAERKKYSMKIKKDHSVMLPSISGFTNKCKEFFQRSDHALEGLFKVVQIFYPEMGKGKWDSLKKEVDNESTKIDNFSEVLDSMLPCLHFVRNARNCAEHPKREHKIITTDFSINQDNQLLPPSIEIVHPKTSQSAVAVVNLMSQICDSIVGISELMLVFLCNRQIRPITGFSVQMLPADQRRTENVKYGYAQIQK